MKLSSLLLLTLLLAILSKVESNTQTVNSLLEKVSDFCKRVFWLRVQFKWD